MDWIVSGVKRTDSSEATLSAVGQKFDPRLCNTIGDTMVSSVSLLPLATKIRFLINFNVM